MATTWQNLFSYSEQLALENNLSEDDIMNEIKANRTTDENNMTTIKTKAEYENIMQRVDELVGIVNDNTPQSDKNYIEHDIFTYLVVAYKKTLIY